MGGVILRCPACKPPAAVRRADGSRIAGGLPAADFVGFLKVPRHLRVERPPKACPNCGTGLIPQQGLHQGGTVTADE